MELCLQYWRIIPMEGETKEGYGNKKRERDMWVKHREVEAH
jgi:hypothetical protein